MIGVNMWRSVWNSRHTIFEPCKRMHLRVEPDMHYKTNSRVIRRIIRFGLVLELSGLVVRTIWLIVRIISSP